MKKSLGIIMAAVVALAVLAIPLSLRHASWNQAALSSGGMLQSQVSTASDAPEESGPPSREESQPTVEQGESSEPFAARSSVAASSAPKPQAVSSKAAPAAPASSKPPASKPAAASVPAQSSSRPPASSNAPSSKPSGSSSAGNTQGGSTNTTFTASLVELVNQEREKAGLDPVTENQKASAAAQVRAKELETSFSHNRPDGRSCFTALGEQGLSYRLAGENIAWGQSSPAQVMQGWMNSPGHRANILDGSFTEIGVGYYRTAAGKTFWVQMFIRR